MIADAILDSTYPHEIVLDFFLGSGTAVIGAEKPGATERQAYRYISNANDAFAKITEKKLERRLNYHIQCRNKLLRDLEEKQKKTPAGIGVQLNILQDIAKLEELYTLKVEVQDLTELRSRLIQLTR